METLNEAAEAVDEPIDAPEEEVVDEQEEVAQEEESDVDRIAKSMGWNPDFEGENAKTAEQYILATNDIKANYARDLKALRGEVSTIGETTATLVQRHVAEQKAQLEEEYRKKWEANDFDGAQKTLDKLNEVKQPATPVGPPPEAVKWAAQREWFDSDPMATQTAQMAAAAAANQGKTTAEQLEYADQQVRLHHPHLFKPAAKKPPAVAGAQTRTASTAKRGKTVADLTGPEREAMNALIAQGITTKEGYLRQRFEDGGQ